MRCDGWRQQAFRETSAYFSSTRLRAASSEGKLPMLRSWISFCSRYMQNCFLHAFRTPVAVPGCAGYREFVCSCMLWTGRSGKVDSRLCDKNSCLPTVSAAYSARAAKTCFSSRRLPTQLQVLAPLTTEA